MADYLIKSTAAQGRVRALAATTRLLAETARRRHNTSPVMTAALGRLLTAAAMMGSMLKSGRERLTLKISGDGPALGLVACANSLAQVKGYALKPDVILPPSAAGKLDVGGAVGRGTLSVTRDSGRGEPFTGTVELVSGEIAQDLTYYYAASEQTPSSVGLGVLMNKNNTVRRAGGFIIQLMPGAGEDIISELEARLTALRPVTSMLEDGMTPEDILGEILGGMGLSVLDKITPAFRCSCTRRATLDILAGLPCDGTDWIGRGLPTEVVCEYCGMAYTFSAAEVSEARRRRGAGE